MHISRKHIGSSMEIRKGLFMLLMLLILLAFPVSAISQTMAWDPLSMDFGQVTIGETGYQTLTLTNTDSENNLWIGSVEFGFNQAGMFELVSTSKYLPGAILTPGESMDVVFSFTPVDFSLQARTLRLPMIQQTHQALFITCWVKA